MEASGAAFIQRLIEARLAHFCSVDPDVYFDDDRDELYRQLFFASMGNTRILGFLLHFAYESHLINGKRIGLSAIHDASRRFYEEKVESYFTIGKFLHETFAERASIFSLKELLESIVFRARELRTHESGTFKKIAGRPPTSHYYVPVEYDALFSTLELNFFITKYFEMSDRDGRKVSIYALNYGLCRKYALNFGRPSGEREFRLYFVERIFDYTTIVKKFLDRNQEIVCSACGFRYAPEHLAALAFFGMRCKECSSGVVQVNNLSRKYEGELRTVSDALLLPRLELGILHTLHDEGEAVRPSFVAGELDCSYQLVGKRAKSLADRGLLRRLEDEHGRRLLKIDPTADAAYFAKEHREVLDVPADEGESDLAS
jgi:DNA-binding MarR family transcriptional regulator